MLPLEGDETIQGNPGASTIATILRHDRKITTYKIALIRALNEVVLTYFDRDADAAAGRAVAVPLRLLADRWVAFYWPFVAPGAPIGQGQGPIRDGVRREDMSFRPALTELRRQWDAVIGGAHAGRASDGYFLTSDLQLSRKRGVYPSALLDAHRDAIQAIVTALHQPIRYAGPPGGQYTVFDRPARVGTLLPHRVALLPGVQRDEYCVCVSPRLWLSFRELSLYVEALCVHEWSLFTERLTSGAHSRGQIYTLLTDRPDNRRPLSWERNQIEILMMEGREFTCPWTHKPLRRPEEYDLDHLVPISVHPVNALWNLVPADPYFNSHVKRDRLPSPARLIEAEVELVVAYRNYGFSASLGKALAEDASAYFAVPLESEKQPAAIARATVDFMNRIVQVRNVATF